MADALSRAKQIIDSRRLAAEDAATQRRLELEAISPELKEVNYRISRAGIEAVRSAGNPDAFSKLAQASVENKARRDAILQGLGLPVDALEPHYTCPRCSDTGVCDGHYCTCLKALVEQFRVDSLSSVTPLKQSTFEDFKLNYYTEPALSRMTQIYNYCKAWADERAELSSRRRERSRKDTPVTRHCKCRFGEGLQCRLYERGQPLLQTREGELRPSPG